MLRMIITATAIALGGYAAACGGLFFLQRSLIYYPQPAAVKTELLRVNAEDGISVNASMRANGGADALLYFGGNGEDVSQSLAPLAQTFPQHAIYLLHYRGYGASQGRPSEEAIQRDALALFDAAHAKHTRVTVIGRSLGTGVAVRLASQRPVARLVLVTPYDSLRGLAQGQFPFFPVRWLLQDSFDSARYVAQVRAPTLVLMAEHDEVIPRASTEQLFARFAPGAATLKVIPGESHNTLSQHPSYLPLLRGP
jgi:pimeloyl-ACP methyl ester carboxylesterase